MQNVGICLQFIFCACIVQDLDTKFHDKETVMRSSAERRVRGYLRLVCIRFSVCLQ